MKVLVLDEAERDLIEGFRFYEAQGVGLGAYFLDSLFSDIDSLQLYAGIHACHFGYHRMLVNRFPFAVYYRVEKGTAKVHAILDCRQNPLRVSGRLR